MAYGISKAAIHAYTRYAASELGEFNVRVNCISPGAVATPVTQNQLVSADVNAMFLQDVTKKHALGRISQPDEIAQSILFLASDVTASFITGTDLVVDGGAGGIGAATAKLFAQHGAIISLFDRDATQLQSVAEECDKISVNKTKTLTFVGDITDDECCQNYITDTVKSFGKIDILINCAGIVVLGKVDEFKMNVFDKVMAVNIRALVVMSSLAIPYLKQTQGNIVSISSLSAHRVFHGMSSYAMSKVAVKTFTQYSASELAQYKVRINCLSPGVVDTAINRDPLRTEEENAKIIEFFGSKHALKRVGQPDEIAHSILFLASDIKSSFITGTDLLIDGGYSVFYESPATPQ